MICFNNVLNSIIMNVKDLKKFGIEGPGEGYLIIDCSTEWCGPCQIISPILEKLRDEGLFHLINVDLDKNKELAQALNIYAVPTLLFFFNGWLVNKDISVDGQTVINHGVMIGATSEYYIREALKRI